MKAQTYIIAARAIIDGIAARAVTISQANDLWYLATQEEPALRSELKRKRTRAQIVARLEELIEWLSKFGGTETTPAQDVEPLTRYDQGQAATDSDTPRPQYGSHQEIVQERIAQISAPAQRRTRGPGDAPFARAAMRAALDLLDSGERQARTRAADILRAALDNDSTNS